MAGVLGGIGTWMLLKMQRAGARWRSIVIIGTLLGALCGVLAVPISLQLAIAVLHRSSILRVATPGFEKLVDITNPYIVSGGLTGILLGLFVGVRLSLVGPSASNGAS